MLSQRSLGASGVSGLPSDEEFNRVSFLSHFDGTNNGTNNVFDDSSSSNHTITSNGDVTQGSFGPFARPDGEWAVSFDGTDDRLSAPDSADFDFGTGDFTIELFFNYKGSIANRWLIGGANHWQLRLKTASSPSRLGEVSFITNGSTEIVYVSPSDLADSAWHHIAITREGTNLRHFLDGALVKTTTNSETINADSALYIGASSTNSEDWDGHISNVRVVKGTAVYTSAFTTPTAPLTAVTNTKLLTCQSNRFVDNSTSDHTITPSGNPAISAFGPFLTSEVYDAAVNGASAYFDGTGDYLTATSSDFQLGTGDLTVEFWAYNTDAGASNNFLDNRADANGFALQRNASNQFNVYFEPSATSVFTSGFVPKNAWIHFCWTRASGVNKFFIDGTQSGSNVSDASDFNSNSLTIGSKADGSQQVTGYMCDIRIIKGTAVEPSTIPTAPLTAVTNTKLLLNMANGQAIDSAAQNNLTLYGDAKISNAQAKFGGTSIYFDGTGDYAIAASSGGFGFGTGAFTWEAWIYALDTTGVASPYIFDFRGGGNSGNGSFYINNTNSGRLEYYRGGAIQGNTAVPLNQWVHVACVRSGTTVKLYQDGVEVGSGTDSANLGGSGQLDIGQYFGGAERFKGYVDDLRISKGVARYTADFTPPTAAFADKGQ